MPQGPQLSTADRRIMIVDDDPDLLILLRMIFEQEQYEVLTVDSGKDCIEELEHGFKGIVLMDLMMPFMDGWSTIRKIVNMGLDKNVIISIISAKNCPDKQKMQELKPYIHDYIAKPFDINGLLSSITHLFPT